MESIEHWPWTNGCDIPHAGLMAPTHSSVALDKARAHFTAPPGYLAACTQGLPLRETVAAARAELDLWGRGEATPAHYGAAVERSRAAFSRIAGVPGDRVAIGSQVSVLVSIVAASA